QTCDTNPGSLYEVKFDLAGNPGGPPTIKTLQVSAASDLATFHFDVTGKTFANMGYQAESFLFTAVASTTTLAFSSLDAGFYGAVVDNVRVSTDAVPTPEPASLLLLCCGLLGLGARRILPKK